MAKHSEVWTCEVCGESYPSEQTATKCEKSHPKISNMSMSFCLRRSPVYPEAIAVTFDDGKIILYHKP